MNAHLLSLVSLILLLAASPCAPDEHFPREAWLQYASPEEAGWSSENLGVARQYYRSLDSTAVMVIHDGVVVAAWGETERRFPCHSIRKSFLNALYGVHVKSGKIDLDGTLAELGIDDKPQLTETEKTARISDLLKSRSGIYHPAAYETEKMKRTRPARGTHRAGEVFWYNNWDFNSLCTIFEQESGGKIFERFQKDIAEPLGMQDFRLQDNYYHLEAHHSIHPAYPFRMSARDMARFGLLFLRRGNWDGHQLLSEEWIEASTRSYFTERDTKSTTIYGYGYLWWPVVDGPFRELGMYSALGYGGHAIDVVPGADLVVVHRLDTFWDLELPLGRQKTRVERKERFELLRLILAAKVDDAFPSPRLVPLLANSPSPDIAKLAPEVLAKYARDYEFEGFKLRVRQGESGLVIDSPGKMAFSFHPLSSRHFLIEGLEVPVRFELDERGEPLRMIGEFTPGTKLEGRARPLGPNVDPAGS